MAMVAESAIDLEDLARRYDTQVLREYLLEQEEARGTNSHATEESAEVQNSFLPEVFDLRPRCFRRLRVLLVVNFVAYWSVVGYCAYANYIRVAELGTSALPPLEVGILGFFALGTQSTLEFAAVACLTQPARASDARSSGLRTWDGVAWVAGLGARTAVLLDAQCLPLMWRGSNLLFLLSSAVFSFSIGIFVFGVQLRLLAGMFCTSDRFSYDKPDLFFKGRDASGATEGTRIAARPPANREDEDLLDPARVDRPPPHGAIKAANLAHISDLSMLHGVLVRLYVPLGCQETQEFVTSITSFSRCFCEDVVQCSVKFFFLMDCQVNVLVMFSLLISAGQAVTMCLYSSTSAMDIRSDEDTAENE